MVKRNSTRKSQSEQVYSRINTTTRDVGTTRDLTGIRVQSNVRPLEAFVDPATLTTHEHTVWDEKKKTWRTVVEQDDIVTNAQAHISHLKLTNPVTGGLRRQRQQAECRAEMAAKGIPPGLAPPCAPSDNEWNRPGSPVPTIPLSGGMKKKRSY